MKDRTSSMSGDLDPGLVSRQSENPAEDAGIKTAVPNGASLQNGISIFDPYVPGQTIAEAQANVVPPGMEAFFSDPAGARLPYNAATGIPAPVFGYSQRASSLTDQVATPSAGG